MCRAADPKKRPAGPYRQAIPPPARHRPGARKRLGDVGPILSQIRAQVTIARAFRGSLGGGRAKARSIRPPASWPARSPARSPPTRRTPSPPPRPVRAGHAGLPAPVEEGQRELGRRNRGAGDRDGEVAVLLPLSASERGSGGEVRLGPARNLSPLTPSPKRRGGDQTRAAAKPTPTSGIPILPTSKAPCVSGENSPRKPARICKKLLRHPAGPFSMFEPILPAATPAPGPLTHTGMARPRRLTRSLP